MRSTKRPEALKFGAVRVDYRPMFWIIGIAGVWTFSCVMAVALCVMARRGDERLSILLATVPDTAADVDFVVTLATPEPAPGVPAPPASRVSR